MTRRNNGATGVKRDSRSGPLRLVSADTIGRITAKPETLELVCVLKALRNTGTGLAVSSAEAAERTGNVLDNGNTHFRKSRFFITVTPWGAYIVGS